MKFEAESSRVNVKKLTKPLKLEVQRSTTYQVLTLLSNVKDTKNKVNKKENLT